MSIGFGPSMLGAEMIIFQGNSNGKVQGLQADEYRYTVPKIVPYLNQYLDLISSSWDR